MGSGRAFSLHGFSGLASLLGEGFSANFGFALSAWSWLVRSVNALTPAENARVYLG